MHRTQFDQLRKELNINLVGKPTKEVTLMVSTGKSKGKLGKLTEIYSNEVFVKLDDSKEIKGSYTKFELVDSKGEAILPDIFDMTGRPITGSNVVAYSISSGENSHALEIGRVIKTNPSGSLVVQPIIRNGERLKPGVWGNQPRKQVTTDRVIILPLDVTLVTKWVLSDFELYKTDSD